MSYLMKNVLVAEPEAWKLFKDGINKLVAEHPENDYYPSEVKQYPDFYAAIWDYENHLNMAEEYGVFRSIFDKLDEKDEGYGYKLFVIGEDNHTERYWNDRGMNYLDDITAETDVTLPGISQPRGNKIYILHGYWNTGSTDGAKIIKAAYEPDPVIELLNKIADSKASDYVELCGYLQEDRGEGHYEVINASGKYAKFYITEEIVDYERRFIMCNP